MSGSESHAYHEAGWWISRRYRCLPVSLFTCPLTNENEDTCEGHLAGWTFVGFLRFASPYVPPPPAFVLLYRTEARTTIPQRCAATHCCTPRSQSFPCSARASVSITVHRVIIGPVEDVDVTVDCTSLPLTCCVGSANRLPGLEHGRLASTILR